MDGERRVGIRSRRVGLRGQPNGPDPPLGGTPRRGHDGWTLDTFAQQPRARKARLQPSDVPVPPELDALLGVGERDPTDSISVDELRAHVVTKEFRKAFRKAYKRHRNQHELLGRDGRFRFKL